MEEAVGKEPAAANIAVAKEPTTRVEMRLTPTAHLSSSVEHDEMGRVVLHLYKVVPTCTPQANECVNCSRRIEALGSFGVALPTALPAEARRLALRLPKGPPRSPIECELEHFYSGPVDAGDLANMQRFHRSILCWESEGWGEGGEAEEPLGHKRAAQALSTETWALPGQAPPAPTPAVVDPHTWAADSHGSYYVLFPSLCSSHVRGQQVDHAVAGGPASAAWRRRGNAGAPLSARAGGWARRAAVGGAALQDSRVQLHAPRAPRALSFSLFLSLACSLGSRQVSPVARTPLN
jgi:hypothetical protein